MNIRNIRLNDPIVRRNIFLITAAMLMLIAIISSPGILTCIFSIRGFLGTALIITGGYFAARGIRELADIFLRGPGNPWYMRPWAILFLMIVMPFINVLFALLKGIIFSTLDTKISIPHDAIIFEFMAAELVFLVFLDRFRPSSPRSSDNEPRWKFLPRKSDY